MIVTTTGQVDGRQITQSLGLVKGNAVRARNIGRDIIASLRGIVGGEIPGYSDLMTQSRDQAIQRMVDEAERLGADAVVEVRFTTATIVGGQAEMLAYGTAVKLA